MAISKLTDCQHLIIYTVLKCIHANRRNQDRMRNYTIWPIVLNEKWFYTTVVYSSKWQNQIEKKINKYELN